MELDFAPAWIIVGGHAGVYDIAIAEAGDVVTVVVREREDNPGRSVTNCIEEIATAVLRRTGLDAKRMRFFETYSGRDAVDEVTFEAVGPDGFMGPNWRRLNSMDEIITGRRINGEGW